MGTARLIQKPKKSKLQLLNPDQNIICYYIGRVAILPSQRGKGLGKLLMSAVEEYLACTVLKGGGIVSIGIDHDSNNMQTPRKVAICLEAQLDKRGFYESLGYVATTEEYYLDGHILHVYMHKYL